MEKISLEFNGNTGLSYSESVGFKKDGTTIRDISYIRFTSSLSVGKNSIGFFSVTLEDILAKQTKIAKKDKAIKESTIALYEQMIADIQAELNKIKPSK